MDSEIIDDLKQFISTTVSQQSAQLKQELTEVIDAKIDALDTKIDTRIDEVLHAVGESTETRFTVIEENVQQLNTRVTKLEAA